MTGLNHAATGTAIALIVKRPELALPLAFISHFVLDSVPHGIMPIHRKKIFASYLIVETIAMTSFTVLCMLAFRDQWLLIGLCAFTAFLPDVLWPFFFNGRWRDKPGLRVFYKFHKWIQHSETYRGWLVEVLYFIVLLIFLFGYTGSSAL